MSRNEDTPIVARSNNYGTTPTLPAVERTRNGNNNNAPLTPNTQIYCLHGRSNNIEVEDDTEMEMSDGCVYRQTTTMTMTKSPCLEMARIPASGEQISLSPSSYCSFFSNTFQE
ncbi:hypothetical protein ACLKA6_012242 [Drosophila palustris]